MRPRRCNFSKPQVSFRRGCIFSRGPYPTDELYYNFWFLPEYQQEYADKYLLFDDITEKELKVFEETFVYYIFVNPLSGSFSAHFLYYGGEMFGTQE